MEYKLFELRAIGAYLDADCVFLNANDEYISEYSSKECNLLFQYTGFTGSNGYAIITQHECFFFTDGRYLLQAKYEILPQFKIIDIANFFNFLSESNFKKIALHYGLITAKFAIQMQNINKIRLINACNMLESIFENRGAFYPISEKLTGQSSVEKINKIQKYLFKSHADGMYITNPQNVCWILNIRGNDEEFTPVYKTTLLILQYSYIINPHIYTIRTSGNLFIEDAINYRQYCLLQSIQKKFTSFVNELKSQKNQFEIEGVVNAHKIDGKILTQFLHELEQNYIGLSEFQVGENLLLARQKNPYFATPSFATICGCNENGAIIHYNAKENSCKKLEKNSIVLLDSGGQYIDQTGENQVFGTTDVTRTVFLGENPPEEYKKWFTLVLKGHIAVATAKLTSETLSRDIDALARKPLLEYGYNYNHGTGHGVGTFLSVHELGAGIGAESNLKFRSGMVISNEPGAYFEGKFGIRIENLLLVQQNPDSTMFFETITLAPIQEKSINFEMLTQEEANWVLAYNARCLKNLH